jgi:hypothetical protein
VTLAYEVLRRAPGPDVNERRDTLREVEAVKQIVGAHVRLI